MKTERLTLLVSPADKAAIAARAAALNMSVSELVRRATLEYDPEEEAMREELEALVPEFLAAVERIQDSFDRMLERSEEFDRKMAELRSPEYREKVRQELASDPSINWDFIARLRGEKA